MIFGNSFVLSMKHILLLSLIAFFSVQPLIAQTDLYNQYSSRTDIQVTSVTKFALDTDVTADVTSLKALDDETWTSLCQEFGLAQLSSDQQQQMELGWDVTMFAQRSRLDPTQPAPIVNEQIDYANSCYVGVSYLNHTIYIFCCASDKQSDVLVNYFIEKMRNARH